MFMGPYTEGGDWNDSGIKGVARFADKFWNLIYVKSVVEDETTLKRELHKTIKKVTEDMEKLQFNTVIAALMEFTNKISDTGIDRDSKKLAVKLIAPVAPHLAEELWEHLGEAESVFESDWPTYSAELIKEEVIELVVQINGKVRGKTRAKVDVGKEEAVEKAKSLSNVASHLKGKEIVKEIFVPGKLINFVVK
jgi:leucyl-tRNA synthetase